MKIIYLDLETFSRCDLTKRGLMPYANHESTRITMISVADGETEDPVSFRHVSDLDEWLSQRDPDCCVAHNAAFDRAILERLGWERARSLAADDAKWICSMKTARWLNLPAGLNALGAYLLGEVKDEPGRVALDQQIRSKGQSVIDLNEDALRRYCEQDVRLMRQCFQWMFEMMDLEEIKRLAVQAKMDKTINVHGLPVDTYLIDKAIRRREQLQAEADRTVERATKGLVKRASQRARLVSYVSTLLPDLPKPEKNSVDEVVDYCRRGELPDNLVQAVRTAGYSSGAKWSNVRQRAYEGRLYDAYAFCAQVHGRWASFGTQLHNFPRTVDQPLSRENVSHASMTLLSKGLRYMVRPGADKLLTVADYRQVEFRILCWLAGEADMLAELRDGEDPYHVMASNIFDGVVTKQGRQMAKSAVLGLGYGMGARGFGKYSGMSETQANIIHDAYHRNLPGVGRLHLALGTLAKTSRVGTEKSLCMDRIRWRHVSQKTPSGRLREQICVGLPSGRTLRLWEPDGEQAWAGGKPFRLWGGAVAEYVICGIARDLLAESMVRALQEGLRVVGHTHDEMVVEHAIEDESANLHSQIESVMVTQVGEAYRSLPLAVEMCSATSWGAAK